MCADVKAKPQPYGEDKYDQLTNMNCHSDHWLVQKYSDHPKWLTTPLDWLALHLKFGTFAILNWPLTCRQGTFSDL